MNNEEKMFLDNQDEAEEQVVEKSTKTSKSSGGWWNNLTNGIKIAIIASIACVLVAVVVLSIILLGGNNGPGNTGDDGQTGNGGSGDVDTPPSGSITYNISIVTQGGMALTKLPVYIYEYEDGSISDVADYAITNENGVATVTLDSSKQYAAQIDNGLPKGYKANPFYPLLSENFNITVTSAVLPDTGLTGVTYTLGSVIQDFTVNTTYLVDDGEGNFKTEKRTFTLSEVLKEKKAVLINFWYTECSWCVTEFPLMQDAYEKYQDDLAIIALDPPAINQDTDLDVQEFQRGYGLSFDMALDNDGLYSAFSVAGYPTSVMIDRYGVITLIEPGAITSERAFDVIFGYFTADDYKQLIVTDANDLIPKEKPDVQMPDSDDISDIFDKGNIDGIEYLPYPDDASDEEKEYSWPFLIDRVKIEGSDVEYDVIKTSNANKEGSYAQMMFNVDLKAGEVVAFDYFSSTELGADILYVVVDGKDIYSISGQSTGWKTCYSYVATEDGTYEIGLVYAKDSDTNYGDDTVYLKDLRIVAEDDINDPTYIYRFAATNPDNFGIYQDYVDVVLASDGYYHVGSVDGPILLADLMGYTRFSSTKSAYMMAGELLADGSITNAEYNKIVEYCNYASNSNIYGVSPVTAELKDMLIILSGGDVEYDWLRFCCYYDAYGTDGKQLEDPIKGLALFSAYDTIISDLGTTDFPNTIVYNKVIMPRGLLYKFTPEVSGTYLITSNAPDPNKPGYGLETNAWVFTREGFGERSTWYTYENVDRFNNKDLNNCYMMLYFEAGKDYYIDIAFYDVYQEGEIYFRVEHIGGEGYHRFTLASPGYFTTLENPSGEMASWFIHGGIDVVLGEDGIWREKRTDDRVGSILYADFTMKTPIFSHSIVDMIELGAFNFARSEGDQYILDFLALNDNDVEKCDAYLRELWGEDYETYAEIYKIEEVYAGIWHGEGIDYTETVKAYLANIIQVGYNEQLGETIEEGDARLGCVVVTAELAEILQLLMDKYTIMNGVEPNTWSVENSWTKLCYYSHYFCAATPK